MLSEKKKPLEYPVLGEPFSVLFVGRKLHEMGDFQTDFFRRKRSTQALRDSIQRSLKAKEIVFAQYILIISEIGHNLENAIDEVMTTSSTPSNFEYIKEVIIGNSMGEWRKNSDLRSAAPNTLLNEDGLFYLTGLLINLRAILQSHVHELFATRTFLNLPDHGLA